MSKRNQLIIINGIGIAIFLISFIFIDFNTHNWNIWINQILVNIALIFFTIVALNYVWNLLGGEPQEKLINKLNSSVCLLANSKDSGLVDFATISGGYAKHSEWMQKLSSAKREIDLMGYSLHSWTYGEDFSDQILNLAKKGVKIRVMIMDENNPDFQAFINPSISSHSVEGIKAEIAQFQKVFEQVSSQLNENKPMFVKVMRGLIASQFCRFDSEICITPYLYSVNTSESPLFVINGETTKLYTRYTKEFNSLWSGNYSQ